MPPALRNPAPTFRLTLSLFRIASTVLACALAATTPLPAQSSTFAQAATVPNRLTAPIVESSRVTLKGSVHPLATKANDRGAVADSMKLDRIQILLKRSDAQESDLKHLINDLHSPGSESYHKWLTPASFGAQFGPSDTDIATLETWLQCKGFSIAALSPARQVLEISGTVGQLRSTFHTQMHQYAVQGTTRYANASAPEIPTALAPVFGGFVSLNNFRFKSHAHVLGTAQMNARTHQAKPNWTIGTSASNNNLILAPADFAVQYDLPSNIKGDNQTIAIVNESNINVELVNEYRSLFGLSANPPHIIIDGNDPGVDGINSPWGPNYASGEAYLDVELAGAVAPNAQIDLVIANDTAVDSGLTLAMEHAVFANVAPVISLSFGGCESGQGSFNTFVSSLWEQAAAQGQTVLVSTGDSGSAGCDYDSQFAVYGQAVNGLASTPYNVAVGGTDFYYSNGTSDFATYWNLTPSNSTATVSLLSHIPEQPWNDSQYGLNVYSYYDSYGATSIAAGSGGPSTLGITDSSGTPTSPYPKPSWQSGVTGIPADGARDLPDVSLFASNGLNNTYYPICAADGDCQPVSSGTVQISGVGGTSASTPAFAGMMALINQQYGPQGQANYVLYPLAAQFPATFNDVTVGTNAVPCNITTVSTYPAKDCKSVSSPITVVYDSDGDEVAEGELSVDGSTAAYNATTGYDLATGLGTVDASNLITNWPKITRAATTTTLTPSATTFPHGTAITISGAVTGASTPTGQVALLTTSPDPNNQAEDLFSLTAGSYTGSINFLPGGTYNLSGYYSGDSLNASSTSDPVTITVTPENSTTTLNIYKSLDPLTAITSGNSISYGAPNILSALAAGVTNPTAETIPTGSVSFLDGSTLINTAAVSADGDAEYNGAFSIGTHAITAKYSGDGSYNPSTSPAKSFTIVKNTPTLYLFATNTDSYGDIINGQTTYLEVQVENSASTSGLALPPTGTVYVSGLPAGTTPTTATLVAGVDPLTNAPQGTAYFAIPASASSYYTVTFTYSGDSNYNTLSDSTLLGFLGGAGGISTTTTATAAAASTSPTGEVAVTVTVTGSGGAAPAGTIELGASDVLISSATLSPVSSSVSSATLYVNSANLPQGVNQVTAQYVPSSTAFSSSATIVQIINPLSDFSIVPVANIVSVLGSGSSAGIQTDVINLSSTNGFAGDVSLSCSAPTGITCSFSSPTSTLTSGGTGSTTLTINTTAIPTAGSYTLFLTGRNTAGTVVHTLSLTILTPGITTSPTFTLSGAAVAVTAPGDSGTSTLSATPFNGFTGAVDLTCAITFIPSGSTGTPTCFIKPATANITDTTAATSVLTVDTTSSTTVGTYVVTITGASGSVTATTAIPVTVAPAGTATFSLSGTPATVASPGADTASTITITPTNGFTGTVNLTCSVTAAPLGVVASALPSCSGSSASVTNSSAATSTLNLSTSTATTPGTYTLTVAGVSGTLSATTTFSLTVSPAATSGSFTLSGTAATVASQGATGTSTITITPANSFTGSVALTCAVASAPTAAVTASNPTCTATSASVTSTTAATATLTINTTSATTTGSYTLTVTGTSATTTATTTIPLTVIAAATTPASFTLSGTAVTIAAQGAPGTSTITVTPANSFTGTVALTCAVTSIPTAALVADNPTCSVASASVTTSSATTATLTINTTAQTAKLDLPAKRLLTTGGGMALGALLLFGTPFGDRRKQHVKAVRASRILSFLALIAVAAGAITGCGSGNTTIASTPTGGTTLGVYTLTVTGTSGTTTATTTITVNVN